MEKQNSKKVQLQGEQPTLQKHGSSKRKAEAIGGIVLLS